MEMTIILFILNGRITYEKLRLQKFCENDFGLSLRFKGDFFQNTFKNKSIKCTFLRPTVTSSIHFLFRFYKTVF